jgi:hypothetical protein
MRFLSAVAALAATVFLAFSPTLAAEKKTVPANKTSGIGFFYFSTSLGNNCQTPGRGTFKVTSEPEHGRVHLEWRKLKSDFQGGCKNSTMSGVAVWYTPEKGFRGKDDFTFRVNVPGVMSGNAFNTGKSWTIKLTVE